jgi:hypothetical protein
VSLDLPDEPPVDHTRAGVLRVAPVMIGWLLRLPPGNAVTGARFDPLSETVELLIEGKDLPPRLPDGSAQLITILCNTDVRPSAIADKYERQTRAHFEHAPESEWVQMPWSIEP